MMFQTFMDQLEEAFEDKNCETQQEGENVLKLSARSANISRIKLILLFHEMIYFRITTTSIGCSFTDDLYYPGLELCNKINNEYNIIKTSLDDEHCVVVDYDSVVSELDVETVVEAVGQVIARLDEIYPMFMKLRWGLPF